MDLQTLAAQATYGNLLDVDTCVDTRGKEFMCTIVEKSQIERGLISDVEELDEEEK